MQPLKRNYDRLQNSKLSGTSRADCVGSRPNDHYFRSVCWFVCLSVCLFVCLFVCAEFFSAVFAMCKFMLVEQNNR